MTKSKDHHASIVKKQTGPGGASALRDKGSDDEEASNSGAGGESDAMISGVFPFVYFIIRDSRR